MTPAQLAALRTALLAETDPALVALRNARIDNQIADWLNVAAVPAFYIWRSSVQQDEIMQNGFAWAEVDNLTVGKARIWEWMFANPMRSINPSKSNVRAGIVECWAGTAGKLAVRQVVLDHCQRLATRGERYFASGAGTATDVNGAGPGSTTFEGKISADEVSYALNGQF